MLIEFSVANFRSFRDKQTFSMVAASRLQRKENTFIPKLKYEKFPPLLKVAAIYGPNASGKSNFIKALILIGEIANRKANSGEKLPVTPFAFDSALKDQPSEFEIYFIQNEVRYQFILHLTPERIIKEQISSFLKNGESLIYSRNYIGDGHYQYEFGSNLNIDNQVLNFWKQITPPDLLFLSQAVASGSEEAVREIALLHFWLLSLLNFDSKSSNKISKDALASIDLKSLNEIATFISEVDIPIENIGRDEEKNIFFSHKTSLGVVDLAYEDESDGTKNLISLWFPWVAKNFFSRDTKIHLATCLLADELDSSLHPKIVAALIRKHLSLEQPSQMIFTTHDTHLMDEKILRRDQFWLTERDQFGATRLYSIYDIEGREGEDIEKRYYEGRYRALPLVRE